MNFLAPFFLVGAAAIAGPIIFHLVRRTTRDVKPFSSLMFLQPTPPRVTSKSRIENLWLLLLRCLVLIALALGFARPFFRESGAKSSDLKSQARRLAILVDTSASMRRENLWAQARERAEALLQAITPLDAVSVLTFDRTPRVLTDIEQWKTTPIEERVPNAVRQLESVNPGWGGTNLGAAVLQALDIISGARQTAASRGEIVIISDMQEGMRLDGLQGLEWPRDVTVRFEPVKAAKPGNASAQWLIGGEQKDAADKDEKLRVRISNAAESNAERFRIAWGAAADAALDAYVPAGQSTVLRVPKLPDGANKLTLTGDDTDFDNTLWLLPLQPRRVPILFLGMDAADDSRSPLYFLHRAFQKTPQEIVEITEKGAGATLSTFELMNARLVILSESSSKAQRRAARQFAESGRLVLFHLATSAGSAALGDLLDLPDIRTPEAEVKDYALLAQIDFQNPIFAPFADPRFSDFTKIHFWHHRRLDASKISGARVIASFDDRDPAMLRIPIGKGGVIVLTSDWSPRDSQLALSSKFIPLLHAILDESSGLPPARAQYFVGDEIILPSGAQPFTMRKPDGREAPVAAGGKFSATDQPGIYTANPGNVQFVVNLDPDESRTSPLGRDRLAALALPMEHDAAAQTAKAETALHAAATETEQRQKLWRWLVVAAAIFLLVETILAARLSTAKPNTEATP